MWETQPKNFKLHYDSLFLTGFDYDKPVGTNIYEPDPNVGDGKVTNSFVVGYDWLEGRRIDALIIENTVLQSMTVKVERRVNKITSNKFT